MQKIQIYPVKAAGLILQCTLLIFAFFWGNQVQAQTLNDYLTQSAENNPEVQANFKQYMAAMERVPQVGTLPNPELTMGVFLRPMETLMGNQRSEISLMQMFPWFGMLRTQKDEASLMARASFERFRESKNQLYFQVKNTYYQLHQIQNEIEIMEENLEILRTMERLAIVRYQGGSTGEAVSQASGAVRSAGTAVSRPGTASMGMGDAPAQGGAAPRTAPQAGMGGGMGSGAGSGGKLTDVLRIQIQIKTMESQLATLEDNKIPLITRFNKLLGRARTEPIELEVAMEPRVLVYDQESYIDSVLMDNPMLKMFDAEAAAFTTQGEMAKLEGRPMIGVGLNYMVFSPRMETGTPGMGMGEMSYMPSGMGSNMVMPMVTLTLPIYRKRFRAMEAEAQYNREAMLLQRENAENNLIIQLDETIRDVRDTERKVNLYREQVRLTQQTLDLMITAYAAEGASFEELLSVQRELLDYRLELLNTIVAQNTAYAMLDMIMANEVGS